MSIPWHPLFVHLPLALAFIVPILALVSIILISKKRLPLSVWWIVAALQVTMTLSGYLAMESGEWEESTVERVTGDAPIHAHEERAEMFVSASVAASALCLVVTFAKSSVQLPVQLVALVLMLGNVALAWRTGLSGGELVYRYKAPAAYVAQSADSEESEGEGLLPTPGQNTSESPFPVEDEPSPAEEDEPEEEDKEED